MNKIKYIHVLPGGTVSLVYVVCEGVCVIRVCVCVLFLPYKGLICSSVCVRG